jgi:hypothetical protein
LYDDRVPGASDDAYDKGKSRASAYTGSTFEEGY